MSGYIASLLQRAVSGSEIRPRAMQPFEPLAEIASNREEAILPVPPVMSSRVETMKTTRTTQLMDTMETTETTDRRDPVSSTTPAELRERVVNRTIDRTVFVSAPADPVTAPVMRSRENGEASPPRRPSHSESPRSARDDGHTAPSVPQRPPSRVIPEPAQAAGSLESEDPAPARGMTRVFERETRVLAPAVLPAPRIVSNTVVNSEPTVHITIGRVDVRAIAPPQPAQPRPPEKPRRPQLTLDEYLRNRGSR